MTDPPAFRVLGSPLQSPRLKRKQSIEGLTSVKEHNLRSGAEPFSELPDAVAYPLLKILHLSARVIRPVASQDVNDHLPTRRVMVDLDKHVGK